MNNRPDAVILYVIPLDESMNESLEESASGDWGWSYCDANNSSLAEVADRLGRKTSPVIGDDGYECEIFAAALNPNSSSFAYVESRSKANGQFFDVTIKIHVYDSNGVERKCDIESYNPYFGCGVYYFRWIDDAAILIYNEKHKTYATRLDELWPPKFIEINYRWVINNAILAHIGYNEELVQRLSFPSLKPMDSVSSTIAKQNGYLPKELSAG